MNYFLGTFTVENGENHQIGIFRLIKADDRDKALIALYEYAKKYVDSRNEGNKGKDIRKIIAVTILDTVE